MAVLVPEVQPSAARASRSRDILVGSALLCAAVSAREWRDTQRAGADADADAEADADADENAESGTDDDNHADEPSFSPILDVHHNKAVS